MSQRIRLGNTYNHEEHGEVLTVHRDHENYVWFRSVESKDNAGVIRSGQPQREQYTEFLGRVTVDDYPADDEWQSRRKAVFERDAYTCQGCGKSSRDFSDSESGGGPRGCGRDGENEERGLAGEAQKQIASVAISGSSIETKPGQDPDELAESE